MKYAIKNLKIDPYRPFFFFGTLMAISTGIHWYYFFGSEDIQSLSSTFSRPLVQFHSYQMIYCTFSYFAFGFLLTVFPKWINAKPYTQNFSIFLLSGLLLSELLLFFGVRQSYSFYILIFLMGITFFSLWGRLFYRYLQSKTQPKIQPLCVLISLFFGGLGAVLGGFALLFEEQIFLHEFSIQVGLYGYILFLLLSVFLRILPFFTEKVTGKECMTLGIIGKILIGIILSRLLLVFCDLFFPGTVPKNEFWIWGLDSGLFFLFLIQFLFWNPPSCWNKTLKIPILATLYLGFFWLFAFLFLSFLKIFGGVFWPEFQTYLLMHDKDFLHLFTLGCVGTLIISIITRVTRGHGGFPLKLGLMGGLAILFMQGGMGIRVFFPLFIELENYKNSAGLFWTLAFVSWSIGYFPLLFREKKEFN